jgi:5-methylthioadenosine/S-adenosylhomocysteine deaminase
MTKIIIKPKSVISGFPFRLEKDKEILIENGIIKGIYQTGQLSHENIEYLDFSDYIVTPGFVQTHIHLCQTLFRGLADDVELLNWLNKFIFPLECAHNAGSMRASTRLGISELIRSGTTTIMDMGSINHEDVIIEEIEQSGLRAFLGKAMMDINDSYPKFKESTKDSLNSSYEFANEIIKKGNPKLNYAFAPRFILSCSDELLRQTHEMHKELSGTLFHTHASENKGEMSEVHKRTGRRNIEAFYDMGLLGDTSCFAHCIWLDENEIKMMEESKSRVLHCPSSNLKLGSGIANIPEYLKRNIPVSLAADGAPCNNNLSMLTEMRHAALIQKIKSPTFMPASTVFDMATLGGAKALHKEHEIGSIETGKKADLVFWDLNKIWNPIYNDDLNSILSAIVYSSTPENIYSVMIEGEFVVRNREDLLFDEKEILSYGAYELRKVIERSNL